MAGVNKVIILGRLGQDPELRVTPNNNQTCTISVATSESWSGKDGKREERTEWHRVVLWGRQAELASKYLKKGRNVYIEGRLQTRSWEDKDGQKRYATEIVANQLVFVDSAGGGGRSDSMEGGDFSQDNFGGGGGFSGNSYGGGGGYDSPSSSQNSGRSQNSRPTYGNNNSDDDVPF